MQRLHRLIIDTHRWLVNIIGTELHENRMAQSITEEKKEQIHLLTQDAFYIGCAFGALERSDYLHSACFTASADVG